MFPNLEFIKTALNAITDKFRHVKTDVDAVQANVDAVKTDVDAVKTDVDAVKNSAPDWNERNSASHAYVKNKPCYDYVDQNTVIWQSNSAGTSGQGALVLIDMGNNSIIEGETYKVTVNGVSKEYICETIEDELHINGSGIFQKTITNNVNFLYAWTTWEERSSVKLEGPLRRYKKLDTKFYDAVMSVNGETGEVEITPENIGAAKVGTVFVATNGGTRLLPAIHGIISGEICGSLYLGGKRWFEKGITSDTGEECFLFSPINTILAGIKTPTHDAHAANKGYVDATVAAPRDSIRLYSSTEGSSKQFEIKVNDDSVISVGGKGQDEEVKLLKVGEAIPIPQTAAVGQTIVVKSVDENGKPTEWEASDIPALDSTLSQPGQAADAAAVGDRLSNLSDEIVTTSESKVVAHNTRTDTHSDIRLLIQGLTDRLNALADSDDNTLDQLSEVVAYIKSNRELIAAITTDKVSVANIIDNLTTNVANKPLSAAQGVALKALIDAITIPESLPNPNALTFSGAVTGSYDGSAKMSARIPQVVSWANKELFNKDDLVDPGNLNSFVTVDGVEYYRYHAGGTYGFTWNNPYPLPGSVTITARGVSQYGGSGDTRLKTIYDDGTYGPDLHIVVSGESKTVTVTTDASKTLAKITGNYDLENWVLLDMSVMSIVANYNVGVPLADSNVPGGIKADPATETDTVPAKIGADGKLYVPDMSGGSGGTASGDYIPVPSTAEVGQTIVVKAVDESGKPTEWAAVDVAGVGGGSEWTKLGDITVNESYEFNPLSFTGGVVTIDTSAEGYEYLTSNARVLCVVVPINIMTKVDNNIVGQLRVTDATAGTFGFYNRDGVAQTSASYDPATYKIVVLNVVDVVMENVPTTYDRYKLRVTTPVISTNGLRSFFTSTIRGLELNASAVINSTGGGFVEIELLTIPGNTNYMYRSVFIAYGKLYGGGSNNEFQAFDIVQAGTGLTKPPANGTVTFTATNMIFVNGTRFELWGANDD